jgi:hypothetical protein
MIILLICIVCCSGFDNQKHIANAQYIIVSPMHNNISSTSAVTSKSGSEVFNHRNKQEGDDDFVTITQRIKLKRTQYEVLKIICDTYGLYISEYIQEVLIGAMKSDIEHGNFCDIL